MATGAATIPELPAWATRPFIHDLRIVLQPENNRVNVLVDPPLEVAPNDFRDKLGGNEASQLSPALNTLRTALEQVGRLASSSLPASPYDAQQSLALLVGFGREVWGALIEAPDDTKAILAIRRHLDERRHERAKIYGVGAPVYIELVAPKDWQVPIELIGLLSSTVATGWQSVATQLPTFEAVVRHTITKYPYPPSSELRRFGRGIPLSYLYYAPDTVAGRVTEYFRDNLSETIVLSGPYPKPGVTGRDSESALADEILLPSVFADHGRYYPSQVLHVHAHGKTGSNVLMNPTCLIFGYRAGWLGKSLVKHAVSTAVLRDRADKLMANGSMDYRRYGPLAFLNACGAGASVEYGVASFVEMLIGYGYRAVLGPRVDMPARIADEMARAFYDWFFSGATLGHALHHAVRELSAQNSILGGLYVCYGSPDLAVSSSSASRE